MLSSLFSKIFADEEPADNKEATKAEEATQEKTEESPAEAVEEEAEEPEDVSCHRQHTPKKLLKIVLLLLNLCPSLLRTRGLLECP